MGTLPGVKQGSSFYEQKMHWLLTEVKAEE